MNEGVALLVNTERGKKKQLVWLWAKKENHFKRGE